MTNSDKKIRRTTKQKWAILSYLQNTTSHPSAEKIYKDLFALYPKLSLSTVYRNISQLSEDGIIDRMSIKFDSDHYDANTIPHNHFICEKCGEIIDTSLGTLTIENLDSLGKVNSFCVYFYGICKKCQQ
jgi:Fur family peroxide stress response transcriptional regulator